MPEGNAPVRKMRLRHDLGCSDSARFGIKSDGPDCRPRIARKAYKQTGATTDVEEPAGLGQPAQQILERADVGPKGLQQARTRRCRSVQSPCGGDYRVTAYQCLDCRIMFHGPGRSESA